MTLEIEGRGKLDPDIMRVALLSKEAGEALPKIGKKRGKGKQAAQAYKAGMHLGNWTDGNADGITREAEALLPNSILFMDNVKHDAITKIGNALRAKGCTPKWFYRPYFNPEGGATGAKVQDYANTVKVRLTEYMQSPIFREAYEAGRVVLKIFNETNIGGEGFNRGRAGFAPAVEAWKTVRAIVKAAFPKCKFMSIANTPGNDDVWFSGDTQNQVYWYHGPQAAKANPTQAEMQAAIQSAAMREMFELCDYIGIHVYANLTSTVSGNLQTWYSRRHEQALKFLALYIAAGKKLVISECDCGYDEGQQVRAREFVWWLANVIGPNDAIDTVQLWWNCAPLEGAWTWTKHFTRDEGGNFFPIIPAIAEYRNGTYTPPNDPPPPDDPEDEPQPQPTREVINLPLWVTFAEPTVATGQPYYELTRFRFVDEADAGGKTNIFILDPHNPALKIKVTNTGTGAVAEIPLDKPIGEPAANVPMFGIGNFYTVEMMGLPSVAVKGMHLPGNRHVVYELTFARKVKEGEVPMPEPQPNELEAAIWLAVEAAQIPVNRAFALPAALIRESVSAGDNQRGYDVVTPEVRLTHQGTRYAAQMAQRWSDNAKIAAYAVEGQWNNVRVIRKGGATPPETPTQTLNINTSRQSPNWNERPNDYRPMVLQLHHTGGGLTSSLNHLCNPASKVSSHYVIGKEGEIYRLVDESKRAWHSGEGIHKGREDPNDFTISLEIVNAGDGIDPYPRKQIDAVIALCRDVVARHSIRRDDVTTHKATRAAWKAKYPNTPTVHHKSDPSANFPLEEVISGIFAQQSKAA